MFKNNWLDNEVVVLENEMKYSKRSDYMFPKMLCILLILLFFTVGAFGESVVARQYFPDTWTCSNPKCKYVNYDGINSCALCGTKRR